MSASLPQRPYAVIILFQNDADVLEATISGLLRQELSHSLPEITAVDLGSVDGSSGIMKKFQPEKFIRVREGTRPGTALNQVFKDTPADWLLLVRAGAEPTGTSWLRELLRDKELNNQAALVASRRRWRPDAWPMTSDTEEREGYGTLTRDWLNEPDAVAAALLNRAAWEKHWFCEKLEAYELGEWANRVEKAGWQTVISHRAEVAFGRRMKLREVYRRAYRAAYSLASSDCELPAREGFALTTRRIKRIVNENLADLGRFLRNGKIHLWPRVALGRLLMRLGESRGFHKGLNAGDPPQGARAQPAHSTGIMAKRRMH